MASRRIYITLNDDKEKDKIIIDFLSNSYSEKDAIKDALYRLATNSTLSMQNILEYKSDNKVQNGTDSDVRVNKLTESYSDEKVRINTKIKQNELNQLKEFV